MVGHACRRCKVAPSTLSDELAQAALRSFFLMTGTWANRGLLLWTLERTVVGFVPGVSSYALPDGTIDVRTAVYRTITRLFGTSTSSDAQSPAAAFDGELSTTFTQLTANGSIATDLGDSLFVHTVALVSDGSVTYMPVLEGSDDGVAWELVQALAAQEYPDGTPVWTDVQTPRQFRNWRVRETGGATLSLRELVLANNPNELNVYRSNVDVYDSLPNKTFQSRFPTQWWFDRKTRQPIMNLWPTPSDWLDSYVVRRSRMVQDPGNYTDATGQALTLEVPTRWYEAAIAGLSFCLAQEHPDVQEQREETLKGRYMEQLATAEREERDNSPSRWMPSIRAYTRA
jgi:hypothetical protein